MSKIAQKSAVAGILVILLALGFWQMGVFQSREGKLLEKIKNDPKFLELYQKALDKKATIVKEPEKVSLYLDLGLLWKSFGELSEEKSFFDLSLAAYEEGIKKFGDKNILFYINGGKLAERVGDYEKAEQYFRQAIKISSADEMGYLSLIDLYDYRLKKGKDAVLEVYAEGVEKMAAPTPLIASRASYLRRIGDYQAAIEDYRRLIEVFPDHQPYRSVVRELESLIK